MSNFKPQVSYITRDSYNDYYANRRKHMKITKQYDTYRALKKDLKEICEVNIDNDGVFVIRSKRSQWGEWYEHWKLNNGKPMIVECGWS